MNICITGACGHIGSAFIRHITNANINKVYLVDNFLTQRYASLFDLSEDRDYDFYEYDILSQEMEPIIKDSDVLIHLAAVTNAEASVHNTGIVEKVNTQGLENIAQLCAQNGCALIFPSTTSVYGVSEGEVDENCPEGDLKPQSPYAESKLQAEKFLYRVGEEQGLRFMTLRLGTIFGASIGMRFHTAVNKFLWQASLGKEITVWKTALHQKRPYCDLHDAIFSFNHILDNGLFDNEIYNIVTANLTVNDIIEAIRVYIPELETAFVDSPIMNQLSYTVSPDKSLRAGFRYQGDLDKRVKETLQYLKNLKSFHSQVN